MQMNDIDLGEVPRLLVGRQLIGVGPVLEPVDDVVARGRSAVGGGDDPLRCDDGRTTSGDLRDVTGCVDPREVATDDLPVVIVGRR